MLPFARSPFPPFRLPWRLSNLDQAVGHAGKVYGKRIARGSERLAGEGVNRREPPRRQLRDPVTLNAPRLETRNPLLRNPGAAEPAVVRSTVSEEASVTAPEVVAVAATPTAPA